ncbi:TonB-dependent receptor [Pseudoteredinibacter isoporae]|uniref:Iron complex outermembrane receptor protein n=1 Tax=Pseudoteredinibacter isoporae TaxID=570281 RepID=A0A7X0MX44_9GAMM|nr:TonB-dependent receptor [Pseudoteredinibacter isoporae]MBB6520487.1 iron complex outermembrane receptor protein [Pseudoteredinibacter isoporae]NHO86054.1 TonB-dependent receptor [Pseudoteredinibacter isoporae]NIB25495.1 TonB-dependent receptor [Pseudoteredinibacter isoporae]
MRNPLAVAIRRAAAVTAISAVSMSAVAQIEEIVVTAQHRAENVQDIPIAVTALGADELKKADIFDAGSIAQHTPGLSFSEFSPGQAIPSLRGISSADDGAGLDNSVALFLDGVYIGRGASINFDMFDLERVEVLRGPQGTLFGRNAIGGAINVVSAKPTDETKLKAGVTVGNEGIVRYQGLVSGALSDNVFGKISINHREHDGYVDNVLLGTELQDEDQTSIRAQLRVEAESSDWLLSVDTMEDNRADMGRTGVTDNAPLSAIMAANGVTGPRQNAASKDGFSDREASGISLQGDIEFDTGTLTTITAYRTAETDWEMASVGAPLGALGLPFDEVMDDIQEEIDTFSQEIRWTSNLDGNFNYTAGLYFFTEETDRTEIFRITKAGTFDGFRATDVGSQEIIGNEYAFTGNETTSYAAYWQGTWEFSEQLHLTLGARYTVDEKDYTAISVNCDLVRDNDPSVVGTQFENFAPCGGVGGSLNIIAEAFEVNPSDDWNDFSPKIALQYYPTDDVMFFASASKGFKSGGFAGSQGVEASASTPVDPETALNYEVGFKGDFMDNSLRMNLTAFYTDYEDLQVVRFGPVPNSSFGTFLTTNIGEAEITGAELEVTWYPTDNFYIKGFYAYMDSEVSDLIIETTSGVVDASGKGLRSAPPNSSNLSFNYNVPMESGAMDFRLEYSYSDEQRGDYIDDRITLDAYELWDARAAWTSADEQWEVALWGKNLMDEDYISHQYVIGPGGIGVWGAPRTYGLTVNYSM